MLCKELDKGEDQCHNLAEKYEGVIEDWWFHSQNENPGKKIDKSTINKPHNL